MANSARPEYIENAPQPEVYTSPWAEQSATYPQHIQHTENTIGHQSANHATAVPQSQEYQNYVSEKKQYDAAAAAGEDFAPPSYPLPKQGTSKSRLCTKWRVLALVIAIIVIIIVVVVPTSVILTRSPGQEENPQSGSGSGSEPGSPPRLEGISIAEENSYGVRAYSRLAVGSTDANDTSFLLFQDLTGRLAFTFLDRSGATFHGSGGIPSNATPLALATFFSQDINNEDPITALTFFYLESEAIQYKSHRIDGQLKYQEQLSTAVGIPPSFEGSDVAFAAATGARYNTSSEQFDGGTTLFACGEDGILHEYQQQDHEYVDDDTSTHDALVYNFTNVDGCHYTAAIRRGPHTYLFTRDNATPDKLRILWRDYREETPAWNIGAISSVSVPQTSYFCAVSDLFAYQGASGGLEQITLTWNDDDPAQTTWGTSSFITSDILPNGTNLACDFIPFSTGTKSRIYFQAESGQIKYYENIYSVDPPIAGDTWAVDDVPTVQLPPLGSK